MSVLTSEQKKQLEMQLESHKHNDYEVNIMLSEGDVLHNFVVHSRVLRPEKMSALYLARWLYYNNGIYLGKSVLDMGSGSGVQGIVMGCMVQSLLFLQICLMLQLQILRKMSVIMFCLQGQRL